MPAEEKRKSIDERNRTEEGGNVLKERRGHLFREKKGKGTAREKGRLYGGYYAEPPLVEGGFTFRVGKGIDGEDLGGRFQKGESLYRRLPNMVHLKGRRGASWSG